MPNKTGKFKLISLETSYQKLKYRLSTSRSTRIKLEHLRLFLDLLTRADDIHEYFSYFDELIQDYIELVTINNLEYRSIEALRSLKLIEDTFIGLNIKDSTSPKFLNAQKILLNQIVLTYIYLGEWYQALKVLSPNLKQSDFIKVYSNIKDNLIKTSESTTLNELVDSLGDNTLKKNKNFITLLSSLEAWEAKLTKPETGKVWVLLIEYEAQDVFGSIEKHDNIIAIGNIQQLQTISHNLPSASAEDFILFNNLSISYNDLLYQQANTAIKVAKNQLGKSVTKVNNKYNVIYSFTNKASYYSGESMGVAMTLTAISSISTNNDYKYKYQLLQDHCITGSISQNGAVSSIAKKSLTIKLRTIFYSPFKKFLLPKGNKTLAIKELNILKERYPNRELDVLAITNIKDTATSTNITLKQKTSLVNRLMYHWTYWKIALIILLIGLGLTTLFIQLTSDKNPVDLKVANSRIEVSNSNGKVLWNHDFGYKLDTLSVENFKHGRSSYHFEDLNTDGLNEVLIGLSYGEGTSIGDFYVFSSKGELLWKYNQHPFTIWGEKEYDNIYSVIDVKTHTFDGIKIIFVSFSKHDEYTTRLVAFDTEGNILGSYWNSGLAHIEQFFDIDDDGVDEIIIGGLNVEYNKGIIAILEYDRIVGHSPHLDDTFLPQNIPVGAEKYYIKLADPKPFLIGLKSGIVTRIDIVDKKILVHEMLGSCPINELIITYTFTKDFDILNVDINNPFMPKNPGEIDLRFCLNYSLNELRTMFNEIEFWDGEKFVNYPVMSNPD